MTIPPLSINGSVDSVYYYIRAHDGSGRTEYAPYIGAAEPFFFAGKVSSNKIGSEYKTSQHCALRIDVNRLILSLPSGYFKNCEVLDIRGRSYAISTIRGEPKFAVVELSKVPSGCFLLRYTTERGVVVVQKLVKQ